MYYPGRGTIGNQRRVRRNTPIERFDMPIRCTPSMFLFLVLLVVGGCTDDSTTPDADASVRGLVVDSRGNPVPGDMAALDDKRISAHRETYRALLKMAGNRAVPGNPFRIPLRD